ncbi:MAG: ATP-binding protein [Ignavibacteriaceae bacterium]|nr:ATP-binding protein [Ignavibacteriaceae bacterium]
MDKNININVLLIEDNPGDARLIKEYLRDYENFTFSIQWVSSLNNLKEKVTNLPDLILLDLNFPESVGIETFDHVHSVLPEIPVIVQTGVNNEQVGQTAVSKGAQDYLVKGNFDGLLLSKAIIYGIERDNLVKKIQDQKFVIKYNEELQLLNKTKDKLFAIIAHDLKTPFQAIHSYSEILNNDLADMSLEDIKASFSYILEYSKNTLILLENLLEWAKLQTNRINFDLKKFDLYYVIKKAFDLYSLMAVNKDIQFIFTCPENTNVVADENIIYTVVRNLISNSLKFTPQSGKVSISAIRSDSIKVVISDNGIGMTPEQCSNIFDADTIQSSKGTMGEHGTGLGLVLCRDLLQKINVPLIIDSNLGQGTSVCFSLPLFNKEQ